MILNNILSKKAIRKYIFLSLLLFTSFSIICTCKSRQSKYEGQHKLEGYEVKPKLSNVKKVE